MIPSFQNFINEAKTFEPDSNGIIKASDATIEKIVMQEIKRLGNSADLNHIDTSGVTDMYGLFRKIPKFNGDISKWDMSNVRDTSSMFYGSQFNGDISKWDVHNVRDMNYMFTGSLFNGDISKWDVSNATYMMNMFCNSRFNGDISDWDVSDLMYSSWMFYKSKFAGDLNKWKPGVLKMSVEMFKDSPLEKNPPTWYKRFQS